MSKKKITKEKTINEMNVKELLAEVRKLFIDEQTHAVINQPALDLIDKVQARFEEERYDAYSDGHSDGEAQGYNSGWDSRGDCE
jgi:hypothetical protein